MLYCFVALPPGHISVWISAKNCYRIFRCTAQKKTINSFDRIISTLKILIGLERRRTWAAESSILRDQTWSWFELKNLESMKRKRKVRMTPYFHGKRKSHVKWAKHDPLLPRPLTTNQMSEPHLLTNLWISGSFNILPQSHNNIKKKKSLKQSWFSSSPDSTYRHEFCITGQPHWSHIHYNLYWQKSRLDIVGKTFQPVKVSWKQKLLLANGF